MDTQPRNQIIEAIAWLLKLLLKTALVLAALAAIAGGGWYGYQYWTVELPQSKVRVEARYAPYEPETSDDAVADRPINLLAEDSEEQARLRLKRRMDAARSAIAEAEALGLCLKSSPIRLRIVNGSSSTVEETTFSFIAKMPKRSTDLASSRKQFRSDKILEPGEEQSACFPVPELSRNVDPETLQWSARIDSVRFAD